MRTAPVKAFLPEKRDRSQTGENERDDHRLVEIVIQRLRRCGVPPEDGLADDGGLGKIVNNQFDRDG